MEWKERSTCTRRFWRLYSADLVNTRYRSFRQRECEDDAARRYCNVLLSLEFVSDRGRGNIRASLKVPYWLAGARVESDQIPGRVAVEHQVACGRQHAPAGTRIEFAAPLHLPRSSINRDHRFLVGLALHPVNGTELVPLAFHKLLVGPVKNVAAICRAEVMKFGARAVCSRVPVMSAAKTRTGARTFLAGILSGNQNRPALRSKFLRPAHFRIRFDE